MKGWYSTGTYYWSKTLVELIPTVATLICFAYVVDIYSEEQSMFYIYAIYMTVGALIAQGMGHLIGIIFTSNQRLAVFTSIGVQNVALFFSGFIIPIKEMHYSIQMLSNLSPFRLIIEIIVVTQYGFERCQKREFSLLLYMFEIENEDFYRNTQLLVFLFFLFRGLTLITLLIKVNSFIKSGKSRVSSPSGLKMTVEQKPRKGDEFQKLYF